MEKKVVCPIIGAVILILIIWGIILFNEYTKFKKSSTLLEEGLQLLREGKYEEGLNKCNQMTYRRGICYTTLLGLKLGENETITTEFCDSTLINNKEPFWVLEKSKYKDQMEEIKNKCYESIVLKG